MGVVDATAFWVTFTSVTVGLEVVVLEASRLERPGKPRVLECQAFLSFGLELRKLREVCLLERNKKIDYFQILQDKKNRLQFTFCANLVQCFHIDDDDCECHELYYCDCVYVVWSYMVDL